MLTTEWPGMERSCWGTGAVGCGAPCVGHRRALGATLTSLQPGRWVSARLGQAI